jgi:hypothetical protein
MNVFFLNDLKVLIAAVAFLLKRTLHLHYYLRDLDLIPLTHVVKRNTLYNSMHYFHIISRSLIDNILFFYCTVVQRR